MLDDSDRAFLAALAAGETARDYAARQHYGPDWAKWKSRRIRRILGVDTIREAIRMSESEAVSRGEFDTLVSLINRLGESMEKLAERPNDTGQQQVVARRELDVKDHAKALGLTVEDVEKLKGEKEYARFRAMQERLDAERAAAEEEEGGEEEDGEGEQSGLGKVLDGLGGITNVRKRTA